MQKMAKPEDVARSVAFLASHRAAGHITGECLSVDGGMEGRLAHGAPKILRTWTGPSERAVDFLAARERR